MSVPHPIPYQGSKRGLARAILGYFPVDAERLIEPFAGSAAVSLAAAYYGKARRFILNDVNEALIGLWDEIIHRPVDLAAEYERLWRAQEGQERVFYDRVRARFNEAQEPCCFLYLLARCVKASVRYNADGEFNQSPDNRRKGTHPETMRTHIVGASRLLTGRTVLHAGDYRQVVAEALASDLVYMDPPYQGVCGDRDRRYFGQLAFRDFVETLHALNIRQISYLVSYDGRTGAKAFGKPLPASLDLTRLEIDAGRSSQATLLGRNDNTVESLYLSPALVARLGKVTAPPPKPRDMQPTLIEV